MFNSPWKALFAGAILTLVALGVPAQEKLAEEKPSTVSELPTGQVEVTILDFAADPRAAELSERIQAALAGKQEWLKQWVREQSKPGEALPWHENFGISETEYEEMLSLAEAMKLQPAGKATLAIARDGDRYTFAAEGPLAPLAAVTLDLATPSVASPFGDCAQFQHLEPNPDHGAIAPWSGINCRSGAGDPSSSAQIVAFSLGRFVESGAIFLRYEGKRVSGGQLAGRADVYLSIP